MPRPINDRLQPDELKRLLGRARVILSACDLDMLIFLHRHPRTLLTSEQVSAMVGYNLKQTAETLEAFIEAGLLERTSQPSSHAARMLRLQLEGPLGGGARDLLEAVSSRAGRQSVLEILNGHGPARVRSSPPELRVLRCA